MRESKQGNQALILLNWLFQDEIFVEAVLRNVSDIISRKDDRYVALGWCVLGRSLVEYENIVGDFTTNGNIAVLYIFPFPVSMSITPEVMSIGSN